MFQGSTDIEKTSLMEKGRKSRPVISRSVVNGALPTQVHSPPSYKIENNLELGKDIKKRGIKGAVY